MAFDDLRKAFGWVSHAILLHKLTSQLGIQGNLLSWLTNYLTDRTQFSVVNGLHSTVLNVTCGIPRGSVLGPQLFTLYTNDQPSAGASGSLFIYADDTHFFPAPIALLVLLFPARRVLFPSSLGACLQAMPHSA